jgi:hypothetical protein
MPSSALEVPPSFRSSWLYRAGLDATASSRWFERNPVNERLRQTGVSAGIYWVRVPGIWLAIQNLTRTKRRDNPRQRSFEMKGIQVFVLTPTDIDGARHRPRGQLAVAVGAGSETDRGIPSTWQR